MQAAASSTLLNRSTLEENYKTMKRLTVIFLCLLAPATLALKIGDEAPLFTLPVIGSTQQLSLDEFADKIVYLDFWASWCGPCRISLPEIEIMHEVLGSDRFIILAINVDEDQDRGISFLKRFPVSYTVLSDPGGEVAEAYQLPGMPSSFVVAKGKISLIHKGFKPGDTNFVRLHVEELLDSDN